jgi:magnesium transporter
MTRSSRRPLAWVRLYRPTEQKFAALAAEFGMDELAVEDAVHPHQRPKFQRRHGNSQFCSATPGALRRQDRDVEFSELHVSLVRTSS